MAFEVWALPLLPGSKSGPSCLEATSSKMRGAFRTLQDGPTTQTICRKPQGPSGGADPPLDEHKTLTVHRGRGMVQASRHPPGWIQCCFSEEPLPGFKQEKSHSLSF